MNQKFDIAILGAGISGFSTALRLQKKGYKTIVLEAHGQIGGCAGFFKKKGFSFDVGATTLVDFFDYGVGGKFLNEIGLSIPDLEPLEYIAWLPDRNITLYRDEKKWSTERLQKLGSTENHIRFWKLLDKITKVFWNASRKNIKLPIQSISDIVSNIKSIEFKNLYYARYLNYTMLDILKKFKLHNDTALKGFISMLIEDTVHSTIDKAPFINATLGTTIRGSGLMRAKGGMKGFWGFLEKHYLVLGGTLKRGNTVNCIEKKKDYWDIKTNKGHYQAKQIVSSLPLDLNIKIAPQEIKNKLEKYYVKNQHLQGGAIVVFLGVPEAEVSNQIYNHHQLLFDYEAKLGNGNNMFISISSQSDIQSAPDGYRSVMISTHCDLADWIGLEKEAYQVKKQDIGQLLINNARKVYPQLGNNAVVLEIGTPKTYEKYTKRINGAVGGFKQTLANSNFNAIPQNIGFKDFYIVGDNTWPGLGTVAGLISSKALMGYF